MCVGLALAALSHAAPKKKAAASAPATTSASTKPDVKPVPPTGPEDEFYQTVQIAIPPEIVLEVSAFEFMPDGRLIVATRRGDIYLVDDAYFVPPAAPVSQPVKPSTKAATRPSPINDHAKFTRWATGLHEVMGLAQRDGWVYASQRGEITRLKDSTGSGRADTYETFYDGWGIKGDYHEYPMMSRFDREGNLYVALCLTGSVRSESPFRGWLLQITPDGRGIPYACGIRSPGALGFNHLGELFYTDNQGFWNGTDGFKHVTRGSFQGDTAGNKWYEDALKLNPDFGPIPPEPKSPSRIYVEAPQFPTFNPPPVWLPYKKVGQSASGIVCDVSGGKFGPFNHQMFVADQSHSDVARCGIEMVKGHYQGFCAPFRRGFTSGIVPMIQATDGSWFVGGTNRGWASTGPRPYALERLVWTGKMPFEMLDMKVLADGFDLSFTQPVNPKTAADVKSYDLATYTYIYQSTYGSPEVDATTPTIKQIHVSEHGLKVKLTVDGLMIGHIHELHMDGLRNAGGDKPLLHPVAYYTLWNIPDGK